MNAIIKNVEYILDKYGSKVKEDKKLIMLYWMIFDKVKMDKETIDTNDFLTKATLPCHIISARHLIESINKE